MIGVNECVVVVAVLASGALCFLGLCFVAAAKSLRVTDEPSPVRMARNPDGTPLRPIHAAESLVKHVSHVPCDSCGWVHGPVLPETLVFRRGPDEGTLSSPPKPVPPPPAQRGMNGRPTMLTPEAAAVIVQGVADGLPLKHAALLAGVSPRTLMRWLAAGRVEAPDNDAHVSLLAAVKKAEAQSVARDVATITKAATERDEVVVKETVFEDGTAEIVTTTRRVFDWHAAAWRLERRHPKEFASNRREIAELQKGYKELEAKLLKLTGGADGKPGGDEKPA